MASTTTTDGGKNIWIACADKDLDRVKQLIQEGVSVDAQDDHGYSALHAAASYDALPILTFLLDGGAKVDIADEDGESALFACESVDAARLLLARGASAAHRNLAGLTASQAKVADAEDDEEAGNKELIAFLEGMEEAAGAGADEGGVVGEEGDVPIELPAQLMERINEVMKRHAEAGTSPDDELKALVEEAAAGAGIELDRVRVAVLGGLGID